MKEKNKELAEVRATRGSWFKDARRYSDETMPRFGKETMKSSGSKPNYRPNQSNSPERQTVQTLLLQKAELCNFGPIVGRRSFSV